MSNKIVDKKNGSEKKLWKVLGPKKSKKNLRHKKDFSLKKYWVRKNVWSIRIIGQKEFTHEIFFVSDKYMGKKMCENNFEFNKMLG